MDYETDYETEFGRHLLAAAARAAAVVETALSASGSSHLPMRIAFSPDGHPDRIRPLDPNKIPSYAAQPATDALKASYSYNAMAGASDSTGWRGTLLIVGGGPASLALRRGLKEMFLPVPTSGGRGKAKAYGAGPQAAALADAAAEAREGENGEFLLAASENILATLSAHERLEMLERSKFLKRPNLSSERLLVVGGEGSRVLLRRRNTGCVLVCSDIYMETEALLACAG